MSTPETDSDFHARCSALSGAVPEAEVAQLRKDKIRLDWLEAHANFIEIGHNDISATRDGIDEAMNQP